MEETEIVGNENKNIDHRREGEILLEGEGWSRDVGSTRNSDKIKGA